MEQKKVVKTRLNYDEFPRVINEVNSKPSETIPDQSMTMREILNRFARGLPISGGKVPVYDDSEDVLEDISYMDLADQEAYINRVRDEYKQLERKLAKDKADAQRKRNLEIARKMLENEKNRSQQASSDDGQSSSDEQSK